MYLIDSNIIVYSYLSEFSYLRNLFIKDSVFVSEISRVEVLGYYKLTNDEEVYFKDIFNLITSISPSQEIFDTAINIRKKHNLKLGDSLISATAMVHDLQIYTRNIADFKKISVIKCIDPVI